MGSHSDKSLKERANPTQLGDPVSLKAETSSTEPTEHDRPNKSTGKSLKEVAQRQNETNPSMLGDPVSLKAETSSNEPTDQDRGALSETRNKSGKPRL